MKKTTIWLSIVLISLAVFVDDQFREPEKSLENPEVVHVTIDSGLQVFLDDYEKFVNKNFKRGRIPGMALAVVKDSHVILQKTLGLREAATCDSVDEHTVFRIGSLSKGFAPVLAAMLVEEGYFNWDDKVIRYLPDLRLKSASHTNLLTIRHLLTHTSGLPRHAYSNLLNMGIDYDTIVGMLPEVDPFYPVGTHYDYQNVIFSLTGDIIEETTGCSYAQMLRERIFLPMGMQDASTSYAGLMDSYNIAHPHRLTKRAAITKEIVDTYYSVVPAAGVNASISDMAQWLKLLLGNRSDLITSEALCEVFEPFISVSLRERGLRNWRGLDEAFYAMGWRVLEYGGKRILYHGGYVNGYRAEIAFSPEERIGLVTLANGPGYLSYYGAPVLFKKYFEKVEEGQSLSVNAISYR